MIKLVDNQNIAFLAIWSKQKWIHFSLQER